MVQLALQEDNYLEACSAYQEVWDTEEVKKEESREVNVGATGNARADARSSRTSSSTSRSHRTITNNPTCSTNFTPIPIFRKPLFTSGFEFAFRAHKLMSVTC